MSAICESLQSFFSLKVKERGSCRKMGLETLGLSLIHEQAFSKSLVSLSGDFPVPRSSLNRRARKFFSNVLLPLEATHQAAVEAKAHMDRMDQKLVVSHQQLIKEIKQRNSGASV